MSQPKGYSKCLCKNCGGHIEFPSDGAGSTVTCPHCNWPTVLVADPPSKMVSIGGGREQRQRVFQIFLLAAVVLAAAAAGVLWYLKKQPVIEPAGAPGLAPMKTNPPAPKKIAPLPPPDPWHGLIAGPVTLGKSSESRLVYAAGTISNASDHQRFSIKVTLDVYDADNQKVGDATDYTPSIDSGKVWKFKAMVVDRTAVKAKLTAVTEN